MSGIMNLPDDEMNPRKKLKAAVANPDRTVPGRIAQPKPIADRTTMPRPKPVNGRLVGPKRIQPPVKKVGGGVSAVTRGDLKPRFGTPEDEDNPRRKAILKRLRKKTYAKQQEEADK